jgi:hypothetical protein
LITGKYLSIFLGHFLDRINRVVACDMKDLVIAFEDIFKTFFRR